jgi:predicted outer membrane repeat protein
MPCGALLYLSGDYSVEFMEPVVQGLWLPGSASDAGNPEGTSIIALGGTIRAIFIKGTFASNHAGTPISLGDEAHLAMVRNTTISKNTGGILGGGIRAVGNSSILLGPKCQIWGNSAKLGGGIYLSGFAAGRLATAEIRSNVALKHGGGVYAEGHARLLVESGSSLSTNEAHVKGGAIFVGGNAALQLSNSTHVRGNLASDGAGIYADEDAIVLLNGSSKVVDNAAAYMGGGLAASGKAAVIIKGQSTFARNNATWGGGLHLLDTTRAQILEGSSFDGNYAGKHGGGIRVSAASELRMEGGLLVDNEAGDWGGGAYGDMSSTLLLQGVVVEQNFAAKGAGLSVADDGTLVVKNCSILKNTATSWGGGLACTKGPEVHIEESLVGVNLAQKSGGGLDGMCNVWISSSSFLENTARISGGGMKAASAVMVKVANETLFKNNMAGADGGGILITDDAELLVANSIILENSARNDGGGICAESSSKLRIEGMPALVANDASSGGGLATADTAHLEVSMTTEITQNQATEQGGGVMLHGSFPANSTALLLSTQNNTAPKDAEISVQASAIAILGPTEVRSFASRMGSHRGVLNVTVRVSGYGDVPCQQETVEAVLGQRVALAAAATDSRGLASFPYLKLQLPAGTYTLAFHLASNHSITPAVMTLHVRSCMLGEITNQRHDACEPCQEGSYSLDPGNFSCDVCPACVSCPGGAVLQPEPGFWHSTPESPQAHRWVMTDSLMSHLAGPLEVDAIAYCNWYTVNML